MIDLDFQVDGAEPDRTAATPLLRFKLRVTERVAREVPPTPILAEAIEVARSQIGVMEEPPGSNRGPEVDEYIRRVGLNPAGNFAWCAAFLYFCFDEAARTQGRENPVIKTAGDVEMRFSFSEETEIIGADKGASGLAASSGATLTVTYQQHGTANVATRIEVKPKK